MTTTQGSMQMNARMALRQCLLLVLLCRAASSYNIGVAIADITGPCVEIAFMGYANLQQVGTGIHLRQFARAFIIEEDDQRIVFVSADVGMIGHGIKKSVVGKLQLKYGRTYTMENVMLSGTHTHSAPGGFLQDMLFDLPSLGFVRQSFDAYVDGIVESIVRAHDRMQSGRIFITQGDLLETNVNRSPTAYENNPEEERKRYKHNVDKTMTQLKFVSESGHPIGVISWYAIHPTSMNNTNTLISSDNVGYASILFEEKMNPKTLPGKGSFVAAFTSTNLGDVSPNTRKPRCLMTGMECDVPTSSCSEGDYCVASGPGNDIFESTYIIAHRLMDTAWDLWNDKDTEEVKGPIKMVHQFVDMPRQVVPLDLTGRNTTMVRGCLQAMGYSFAAGTTDGPGAFNFRQGTTTPNALWNAIRNFLAQPTDEDIRCQAPKPILLATGQMDFPFEWQPRIVPMQVMTIGQVALIGVPGEFTTMSGRRLRSVVKEELLAHGFPKNAWPIVAGLTNLYSDYITTPEMDFPFEWQPRIVPMQVMTIGQVALIGVPGEFTTMSGRRLRSVVKEELLAHGFPKNAWPIVAGLTNLYSDYITTPEEYQVQRYEGASTIFGEHTLSIYLYRYKKLAQAIMKDQSLDPGPEPPELMNDLISLVPPVFFDTAAWQYKFGDCVQEPPTKMQTGQKVTVVFVAGNPRNHLMHQSTYLTVERHLEDSEWEVVATDANWETKFMWKRKSLMLGSSEVTIEWVIPPQTPPGMYRIRHFGHYKHVFSGIHPYEGSTRSFMVETGNAEGL